MAQTIATTTNAGLFNASATEFTALTENSGLARIAADLSDCKDSITVIVDIPAGTTGDFVFTCLGEEFEKDIELTTGKLNSFRITTKGLKKADGTADFMLTSSGAGFASLGVRIAFLKYTEVINH